MPFLFLIAGILFTVSAARNTQSQLLTLLKGDFTGKGNFIYWMVSILIVGSLGYIPRLKPVSVAFLALIIIVLFLKNGGVFSKATSALGGTTQNVPLTTQPTSLVLPNLSTIQ